jgi:hypothetical protein
MKSIPRIIEEQVQRWQIMQKEEKEKKTGVSIITVSREPGSGGRIVAARLADKLGKPWMNAGFRHWKTGSLLWFMSGICGPTATCSI